MPTMPSEARIDRTLALRLEGYQFIPKGCERHHSDVFETRLFLRRTICMRGEEAADDHRVRKQLWLDMTTEKNVAHLAELAADEWCRRIPGWAAQPRVVLQDEVAEIFCRAVCTWAGVPVADRDVPQLAARLGWFLDSVSAVGPRYLRGRIARIRLTRWAEGGHQ